MGIIPFHISWISTLRSDNQPIPQKAVRNFNSLLKQTARIVS
jgi:hypothetical protein